MAERDLISTSLAAPPRALGGWIALAVLLAVTLGVGWRQADRRLDAPESAAVLAATSLIGDGDLGWRDSDRARFSALGNASRPALAPTRNGGNRLDASPLHAAWLAPWATFSPRRGSLVAGWLALAIAASALAIGLRARLGSNAPWWAATAIWGSGAFASALRFDDSTLVLALMCVGLALILGQGAAKASELGDMYRGDQPPGGLRVVIGGILLGLAAASRPWLVGLVLVLPVVLATRRVARGPRILASALGLGLAAGVAWANGSVGALLGASGFESTLLLRNALTLFAGPRFGLVLVTLPIVLALVGWGVDRSSRVLLAVPLMALTWFLLAMPFSWSGAPATLAGPWPLAVAAAWWAVSGSVSRRLLIVLLLVGQVVLAPAWGARVRAWHQAYSAPLLRWLPWETTQPSMPGETEILNGDLLVRSLGPGLVATRSGELQTSGGWAAVLIASPAPLERFAIAMSADAPSSLPVRGATVGDTMFRADGGVAILLTPTGPTAVHPDASGAMTWWYRLDLDAGAGGFTVEFAAP